MVQIFWFAFHKAVRIGGSQLKVRILGFASSQFEVRILEQPIRSRQKTPAAAKGVCSGCGRAALPFPHKVT